MTNDNNDIMKKIQADLSKLCKRMDNIEKSVNKQDQMANEISFINSMMNRHPEEINPPSATQSPKTPEGETSLGQGFMGREKQQIPQIHFDRSQYYTHSLGRNHLKIKNELPRYDGKNFKGVVVWVNKMDAIFLANPPLGEQEKVITASTYLEAKAYDWFLWWSSKCTELKLHKPKTIEEAKHEAIIIERKYKLHKTPYVTNDRTNNQFKGRASKTASENTSKYVPPPLRSEGKQQINVERKKDGKCWKCGDKYHPGDKCATQKLYNSEAKQEEESSEDSSDEEENEENENPSPESEDEIPRISIAAITRIAQPQTLKLKGYIKKQSVIVMVDSGSTDNFVDVYLAKRLNIFAYPVADLKVMVADGKQIDGVGKCHKVKLQLSDYAMESSFYTVPLGGVDVVLGVQWLRSLGTCSANHIKQFIKFKWDGRKYQLFGFQAPPTQVISAQQMKKLIRKGAPTFVAQCQYLELLSTEGTHQTSEISSLTQRNEKVFQDLPMKLPPERKIKHIIEVKIDSTPVNVKPYCYPHHHKTKIERLIQDLLKHGIITKSRSPYAAPVALVRKKDESFRLCIDYKGLNKITIKHKFPILFIDEMLDELHGAEYFSKLDLRSSYYQIRVRLKDIKKTAFRTHEGHYEFKAMPFRLTNAPATFQATMNELFHPYLRKFILVFFDDILVYSKTWKEHRKHLEEVLSVLEKNQFYAKLSKCTFGQKEVEYLGHIISREGVQVDPNKIKAIKEWSKPKNISKLRGFLGLTRYYRRFIKNYAHLTAPLTNLLKKNAFKWDDQTDKCFEKLKEVMSTTPVLATLDFSKQFVVECDASGFGISAVLMQDNHPIAFESRKLNKQEGLKSTYQKEMLAIIHALTKWR
eukprot:PITA_02639